MSHEQSMIDIINHILVSHPDMVDKVQQLIYQKVGKSSADDKDLLRLNKDKLKHSKSQIKQDLFVLHELSFKTNGFFVEFGATNGVDLSNTFLLEKYYGWNGILAEPAKIWHSDLQKNRSAHIEQKCVWHTSNQTLQFSQTDEPELSGISDEFDHDDHAEARKKQITYDVETISINDLLEKYKAPPIIDYLSIDTEGSEYDILKSLDFSKYKFRTITCEHNFTSAREKIFNLLSANGYKRTQEDLSQWDDWYVLDKSL